MPPSDKSSGRTGPLTNQNHSSQAPPSDHTGLLTFIIMTLLFILTLIKTTTQRIKNYKNYYGASEFKQKVLEIILRSQKVIQGQVHFFISFNLFGLCSLPFDLTF